MWWLTRVRSHSMAPTLTDGQLVLTRSLRPTHAVGRGDLVVLASPVEPDQHLVKRVVGLPGEKVTFDAGRVNINGRPLREPYASPSMFRGEYDVPPGHFLVLGDNRDVSSDSRSWSRPYTPRSAICGRLVRRRISRNPPSRGKPRPPRRTEAQAEPRTPNHEGTDAVRIPTGGY